MEFKSCVSLRRVSDPHAWLEFDAAECPRAVFCLPHHAAGVVGIADHRYAARCAPVQVPGSRRADPPGCSERGLREKLGRSNLRWGPCPRMRLQSPGDSCGTSWFLRPGCRSIRRESRTGARCQPSLGRIADARPSPSVGRGDLRAPQGCFSMPAPLSERTATWLRPRQEWGGSRAGRVGPAPRGGRRRLRTGLRRGLPTRRRLCSRACRRGRVLGRA